MSTYQVSEDPKQEHQQKQQKKMTTTDTHNNEPKLMPTHDSIEIDYESLPADSSLVAQLTAGAFAGIAEHTVMYPVDAIKTRAQILNYNNGSNVKAISEGIIRTATKISSTEGAVALWRGISSVVLGAGPAHAVYFSVFETTKTSLVNYMANINDNKNNDILRQGQSSKNTASTTSFTVTNENHPLIASIAGIAATTASDALMTPFDVLKQRMQTFPHKISLLNMFHKIYKAEGISSFFVSYPTTLFLSIPFAALNFGVYEYSSSVLNPSNKYNPMLHCISGGISGAIAAAITTPLDCVKTALQTRGISKDPNLIKAKGFKDATIALYRQNGYQAFLRGLRPRVIFNVPSTAISWTAYEMAKAYLIKN